MEPDPLQKAISLFKSGEIDKARLILWDLVHCEPDNEVAWLWLAACVLSDQQKRYCLEKALEINPKNERVRQAIDKLTQVEPPSEELFAPVAKTKTKLGAQVGGSGPAMATAPSSVAKTYGQAGMILSAATCLACGGNLEIPPLGEMVKCAYCGTEHIIHREAGQITLEAFARCPVCGRNDRVEKVTAIVISQTHKTVSTTEQVRKDSKGRQFTQKVNLPTVATQASILAQRLAPPTEPVKKRVVRYFTDAVILALILFLLGLCGISFLQDTEFALLSLVCFGLGALLFILWVAGIISYRDQKERNIREFEFNMTWWKYAKDRWEHLYYCSRDDCVFVPGEEMYASSTAAAQFIYQVPKPNGGMAKDSVRG